METRAFKDAAYTHLAEVGRALSSPVRLEILDLLTQAPRTVERISEQIGQSVANTSHHLQVLRRAHLVHRTRMGTSMRYRCTGSDVIALAEQLQRVARAHVAELDQLTTGFFVERDGLQPIDRQTLSQGVDAGELFLLDVRPADEFEEGHLPGARSIPIDELRDRLAEIPTDRPVVAYCRGPWCVFSADAVKLLREHGIEARRSEVSVAGGLA